MDSTLKLQLHIDEFIYKPRTVSVRLIKITAGDEKELFCASQFVSHSDISTVKTAIDLQINFNLNCSDPINAICSVSETTKLDRKSNKRKQKIPARLNDALVAENSAESKNRDPLYFHNPVKKTVAGRIRSRRRHKQKIMETY